MNSPYQSENRSQIAQRAIDDPRVITIWERNGLHRCMGCQKNLRRGVDIDIYCDVCWDATIVQPDTPEKRYIRRVAKMFRSRICQTEDQSEKDDIFQLYRQEYAEMERAFLDSGLEDIEDDEDEDEDEEYSDVSSGAVAA